MRDGIILLAGIRPSLVLFIGRTPVKRHGFIFPEFFSYAILRDVHQMKRGGSVVWREWERSLTWRRS